MGENFKIYAYAEERLPNMGLIWLVLVIYILVSCFTIGIDNEEIRQF